MSELTPQVVDILEEAIDGKIQSTVGKSAESTHQAQVASISNDGVIWVRLLGADEDTPVVESFAAVKAGEWVSVKIENGRATIIGNYTEPAVGPTKMDQEIKKAVRSKDINPAIEPSKTAKELAEAADRLSRLTNQHFWNNDTGAYITDIPQEDYLEAYGGQFPDWDPVERPYFANILTSEGNLLRTGNRNLAAFTQVGTFLYDGNGNEPENIMAIFGKNEVSFTGYINYSVFPNVQRNVSISNTGINFINNTNTGNYEITPCFAFDMADRSLYLNLDLWPSQWYYDRTYDHYYLPDMGSNGYDILLSTPSSTTTVTIEMPYAAFTDTSTANLEVSESWIDKSSIVITEHSITFNLDAYTSTFLYRGAQTPIYIRNLKVDNKVSELEFVIIFQPYPNATSYCITLYSDQYESISVTYNNKPLGDKSPIKLTMKSPAMGLDVGVHDPINPGYPQNPFLFNYRFGHKLKPTASNQFLIGSYNEEHIYANTDDSVLFGIGDGQWRGLDSKMDERHSSFWITTNGREYRSINADPTIRIFGENITFTSMYDYARDKVIGYSEIRTINGDPDGIYRSFAVWNPSSNTVAAIYLHAYDDGTIGFSTNNNGAFRKSMGLMGAKNANGYWGLTLPDGTDSNWVRSTQSGIIPYQSGGHGSLGTSSWPWNALHTKSIYLNGSPLKLNIHASDATATNANAINANGSVQINVPLPAKAGFMPGAVVAVKANNANLILRGFDLDGLSTGGTPTVLTWWRNVGSSQIAAKAATITVQILSFQTIF